MALVTGLLIATTLGCSTGSSRDVTSTDSSSNSDVTTNGQDRSDALRPRLRQLSDDGRVIEVGVPVASCGPRPEFDRVEVDGESVVLHLVRPPPPITETPVECPAALVLVDIRVELDEPLGSRDVDYVIETNG